MGDWGAAGKGAAGGAMTGAAIGSVAGPWGTVIGGAAGGLIGGAEGFFGGDGNRLDNANKLYGSVDKNNYNLPGFDQSWQKYTNLANQYGGRAAGQANYSGFRGQQQQLGGMLGQEAMGRGIGQRLIQQQTQGTADRGMQQQYGMAAGARPGQGGLAMRQAMMNSGNMNAQVGGQSAQAMGNYQLGAMNNYGQFLQGARGQDEQTNQFNVDARLKQLGLNDQSQLAALQQRLQAQQYQQQGGMGYEQNRTQRYGIAAGAPTSQEQMMSGMAGLGAAYLQSRGGGGGK